MGNKSAKNQHTKQSNNISDTGANDHQRMQTRWNIQEFVDETQNCCELQAEILHFEFKGDRKKPSPLKISQSLNSLNNIRFTNLKILNLSSHYLCSIETITRLDAKRLKNLDIYLNNLITFKSLRKADFPQLSSLNICSNQKKELCSFSQAHFSQIKCFLIDVDYEKETCLDIRWMIKLSAQKMDLLYLWGYRRIPQNRVYWTMKRRWKSLHLGCHHYEKESGRKNNRKKI